MQWRDFIDDSHPAAQQLASWLGALWPPTRNWAVGELDSLIEDAAAGKLTWDSTPNAKTNVVPVRANPELFELRWKLLTTHIRQYHAEPTVLPDHLVSLHMHIKSNKAHQDQQISDAQDRYNLGAPTQWL